ncbi:MAG: A24 family peptidase C-terminal domain-containing protein [Candidatus Bathyarchaeales archaeon]
MSYQMNVFIEGLQVFVALAFLLYASWSDLKTREVSNMVWIFFAPIGLALSLTWLFLFNFSMEMLYLFGISAAITSALAVLLFYAGAYGGADAKALICLSVTLPFYPSDLIQFGFAPYIFPLSVFSNGVILAALSVVYALARNLIWRQRTKLRFFEGLEKEPKWRKLVTLLSGYKISLGKLEKSQFLYPLEDVQISETGNIERKLLVFPKDEEREGIAKRILDAVKKGVKIDWVWTTPGLPMLIFITFGLISALVIGDFVWIILSRLLV